MAIPQIYIFYEFKSVQITSQFNCHPDNNLHCILCHNSTCISGQCTGLTKLYMDTCIFYFNLFLSKNIVASTSFISEKVVQVPITLHSYIFTVYICKCLL